jgi:RNA-directed DNA polymerase
MRKVYSRETLSIRSLKHLALRLSFPLNELIKLSIKTNSLYKFKEEKKESGGVRIISDPKPILKIVQSQIHSLLQEIIPPECAHGAIKGRSNISNAKIHCGQNWVWKLDFKSFYPNISNYQVYNLFRYDLNCSPDVAHLITKLCTVNGGVPQGGPMSSDIAILVCRKLGRRLKTLADKFEFNHTQYIDDLAFSGRLIPFLFRENVKQIIAEYGFKLNPAKESLTGRHKLQIVTGLSVNRERPYVPRKKRREVRAEKYIFNKFRAKELPEELRIKEEQKIQGKESYLRAVSAK